MNDENINNLPEDTEESYSEPANQDQIQNIEGTEATASMSTPFVQPMVQTQPLPTAQEDPIAVSESVKKPRRNGFKLALIAIASLVLFAAIAVGVFYAFIRTPNSKYDSAIQDMKIMKTTAESTRDSMQASLKADSGVLSYEASKRSAATYVDTLKRVKANPVFDKDMTVKLSYVENKSLIEPYGQSTLDMISTLGIYDEVTITCNDAMNANLSLSDSKVMWEDNFAPCEKLLKEHPTVEAKEFNEKTYTKYVAAVKRLIAAAYGYIDAVKKADIHTMTSAGEEISEASSNYSDVLDSTKAISNTAQPSTKIGDVIKVLEQRKNVFFRW